MKHLNSIYRLIMWMGMCESDESSPKKRVLSWILVSLVIINQFVFLFFPCGLAVYRVYHSDDPGAFDSIIMIIGAAVGVGSAISFAIVKSETLAVFRQINAMIDERNHGPSIVIFQEVEKRCQMLIKRILGTLLFFGSGIVLSGTLLNVAMNWRQGVTGWDLPFRAVLPFDQSTVAGFVGNVGLEFGGGCMTLAIFSATLSYHISCCVYIEAFFDSWETILEQLDHLLQPGKRGADLELKKKLIELAQYYLDILTLIGNQAEVMQGTIFSHLYGNVGMFATSIYLMERSAKAKSAYFFLGLDGIWDALILLFMCCYYSTNVTTRCALVAFNVYQTKWYLCPKKYNIYFLLIMQRSQQPIYFHGLKIVNCTMETFQKLINTATSYYLMFRRMMF